MAGNCVLHPVSCAAQKVTDSGMNALANGMFDLFGKSITYLSTFWVNLDSPDLTTANPVVKQLSQWLVPLEAAAVVLALVFSGSKLMWSARYDDDASRRQLLKGLVMATLVVGAGSTLVAALMAACDSWAQYVLDHGVDNVAIGKRMAAAAVASSQVPALGAGLAAVLYLGAGVASLGQAALQLVRAPVMVMLVGVWAISAFAAMTKTGGDWFNRLTSWLGSWAIYKLAAALVYATAFTQIGQSTSFGGTVGGLLLLIVAVLTLPALMRLIAPLTSSIGAGGGGIAMLAATGAVAAQAGALSLDGGSGAVPQTHDVGQPEQFSGQAVGATGATGAGGGEEVSGADTAGPAMGAANGGAPATGFGAHSDGAGLGAGDAAGDAAAAGAGAAGAGPAGMALAGASDAMTSATNAAQGAAGEDGNSS